MKKRFLYKCYDRKWEYMQQRRERERTIGEKKLDNSMIITRGKSSDVIVRSFYTSKAFSVILHVWSEDGRPRYALCKDRKQALFTTQRQLGKRLVVGHIAPIVWSWFVDAFSCTYSSVVHDSATANCVCWIPRITGKSYIPMRSSEICCRNIAKMTHGGWVKMETWGKFFVDCLLKTAPYGIIEYTPKRWFPPICEKGDYFDPVLTDEEIAKHEQLSKQWKSEEERVSILLGLPLDVVNESPDRE